MSGTPDQGSDQGKESVLGDKGEFGKHDQPGGKERDREAKEEIGHMGEKSPQTDRGS